MTDGVPNPSLLDQVPITARTVGHIGDAPEALRVPWSRRNPAGAFHPLHPDLGTLGAVPDGSLDCLVVAVAQTDLASVLRRAVPKLQTAGVLVVDVPNVAHAGAANRGQRAEGPSQPAEAALATVLTELGFRIIDRHVPTPGRPEPEAVPRRITPGPPCPDSAPANLARRTAPARLICRAMRAAPAKLRVIHRVLRPIAGVYDARVHVPMRALATLPGFTAIVSQRPSLATIAADTPCIVIDQRRSYDRDALPYIRRLRSLGCLLVAETDDDPDRWPELAKSGYLSFRGVHAVQTSTPSLAAVLSRYNPETIVLPNTLAALPETRNFRDPARLTLFFGALNRSADLAPWLPALNRVLADAGDRLHVAVVHDREAFAAIETPHKRFTPTASYAAYLDVLGGCEIALLPLADTRFNRMKSDLKFIEAAGSRLACVASPTVYAGSIVDGKTGLIAGDGAALRTALSWLAANPGDARRLADDARAAIAATRMMAGAATARLQWYQSLWARRGALDQALLARVPELRAPA